MCFCWFLYSGRDHCKQTSMLDQSVGHHCCLRFEKDGESGSQWWRYLESVQHTKLEYLHFVDLGFSATSKREMLYFLLY